MVKLKTLLITLFFAVSCTVPVNKYSYGSPNLPASSSSRELCGEGKPPCADGLVCGYTCTGADVCWIGFGSVCWLGGEDSGYCRVPECQLDGPGVNIVPGG